MGKADDKPQRETVELTVDEIDALKVSNKPPAVPRGRAPRQSTVELTVDDLELPKKPPPPPNR